MWPFKKKIKNRRGILRTPIQINPGWFAMPDSKPQIVDSILELEELDTYKELSKFKVISSSVGMISSIQENIFAGFYPNKDVEWIEGS